jgi:hypothetical protein
MITYKNHLYLLILIGLTLISDGFSEESKNSPPLKEYVVHFPTFPKEIDLQSFTVDEITDFSFFLDSATLKTDKDGITRYTIVISSKNGINNIFYEGIRCITAEYKIFAYGTPQKTFTAKSEVDWQPIRRNEHGWPRFRNTLYEYYFCDPERTERQLDKDDVMENLHHPDKREMN